MTHVLIFWLALAGASPLYMKDFNSEESCVAAGDKIKMFVKGNTNLHIKRVQYICIPK